MATITKRFTKGKALAVAAAAFALVGVLALAGCGSSDAGSSASGSASADDAQAQTTITVGASATPHAEILNNAVKPILAEQGITLEVQEFTDYVMPNTAVEQGDLDANYFQHITYLNDFNEKNGTHLVDVADVHFEPFALYAGKSASLDAIPEGGTVAVPNDATNEARALLLLEQEGLIKLADGAGINATVNDIVENPKNLQIEELEAAIVPTVLEDVDIACINGNYALSAGLDLNNALATESAEGEAAKAYVNVLAVKEGNENNEAVKALAEALTSDEVRDYINETFDGAVVPVF